MANGLDSIAQSISDSAGHYDIDGISSWHGKIVVGSGVLDETYTKDQSMKTQDKGNAMRQLTLPLHGLACGGGGSLGLEKQIMKLKGVAKVYVNPATSEAYLDVSNEFQVNELLQVVEKNGLKFEEPRWN